MLLLTLFACKGMDAGWDVFSPVAVDAPAVGVVAEAAPPEGDGFGVLRRSQACMDDPLNCDEGGEEPEPEVADLEPVLEPEVAPEPDVETEPEQVQAEPEPAPVAVAAAPVAAPPAVGLATQAAWGVRLLGTLPGAQPPRAALGLPSGEEVVVAPGSMLPDVGVVVISVGTEMVQLAKVTPNGDHALVETVTLTPQYED